jgi:hypothetical protein
MAFSEDDMKALRLLLREELQAEVRLFRNEVGQRFDEVATRWTASTSVMRNESKNTYLSGNRSDASKPGSLS